MLSAFHSSLFLAIVLSCACAASAQAFILSNPAFQPWLNSASGSRNGNGQPVTLTWSFVEDGTSTPSEDNTRVGSNLLSFLDTTFGGTPSPQQASDLTARPWFDLFQQSFDRWEALSGIDYVYQSNDDGASLGRFSGVTNLRGDIRIGGRNIDGANNTLAFAFLPSNASSDGDIVIDTSETAFFGNSNGNFRRFRNTVAHELGHTLALSHVVSDTDRLLLEPSISLSFDGPQLDEVRAVHFFYGDVHEKSNNGLGNGTASRATELGSLVPGNTTRIGSDANVPTQFISPTATDFVSISNLADTDYFSFTITQPSRLEALLTPLGGTFSQGGKSETPVAFDASARNDLALTIFDTDGSTPLATIDNTGLGASESLQEFSLLKSGKYFARVTGAENTIQLYQLEFSAEPVTFLAADFNEDLGVDTSDLAIWGSAIGISSLGDTDKDGDTDGADFLTWQRQFGSPSATGVSTIQVVPEPKTMGLLVVGFLALRRCAPSRWS